MANLLEYNTLRTKVKSYIDLDNEIKTAPHAFSILMVATILKLSDEEAADSITDGSKDRGVDAVFIDDLNRIHIFQFKYAMTFETSKKNFPSGEIDKLVSYFKDVLDENKKMQKSCNPLIWNKTQEIWTALKRANPKFHIHFCGNTEVMEASELQRADDSLQTDYAEVHHYSLSTIAKLFAERTRPQINGEITIIDKDYFERSDGDIKGMICSVESGEIVKLVTNPKDSTAVRTELFNDNVRVYLSKSNNINKKIIESALSEKNAHFWYLNNGITMTCDSLSYVKGTRSPKVTLKNIQIVNGGQTTHALFEAYHENAEALKDVLVLLRIIETKSSAVSAAIAESTNSQTPIKGRDLRSNDETQKRLEMGFRDLGFFYERKAKQWQVEPRTKRIDAQDIGQSRLAYSLGLPEVAKKDRGRIFADLYETVFSDDITCEELLCAYFLMCHVDRLKKTVQAAVRIDDKRVSSRLFLIDGGMHVLYATHLLCIKNDVDTNDYVNALKQIDPAIKIVRKIVVVQQKRDVNFSFNRFFKDAKTKDLIAASLSIMQ